jgi:hypothetical protein
MMNPAIVLKMGDKTVSVKLTQEMLCGLNALLHWLKGFEAASEDGDVPGHFHLLMLHKELDHAVSFAKEPPIASEPSVGVREAMAAVGNWLEFVRSTEYVKGYPNWPSAADAVHSSLLFRLLNGEKPLPTEEYEAAKKAGKV